MKTIRAILLPLFYQADFDALPSPQTMSEGQLVAYLREDNARGALIEGEGNRQMIAVWSANEEGADADYYNQFLDDNGYLEDPGDANLVGTAAAAVWDALTLLQ